MKNFRNKLVYITGASSGIGLALAKKFSSLGADIVLLARTGKKLEEAREETGKFRLESSQKVGSIVLDVSDHDDVQEKINKAVREFGAPDILVNNAGILKYAGRFETISYQQFDEVMKTNVYGVRNVTHAILSSMKEKRGHIVIIASTAGLFGMYGYTAYGTSKAALIGFAESLRYELKPLGMPVTLVCPPEVDTPMIEEEKTTLPREGRAVKNSIGIVTAEFVADVVMNAVSLKQFLVLPGRRASFLYALHRLSNGRLSRFFSDSVIKRNSLKNKILP